MARMLNWTDRWERQDEKKKETSHLAMSKRKRRWRNTHFTSSYIKSGRLMKVVIIKMFVQLDGYWISKYVLDIICIRIKIRDFFLCSVFSEISLKWKRYKMDESLYNNIDQMKSNNKPNKPNDESRKTTHEMNENREIYFWMGLKTPEVFQINFSNFDLLFKILAKCVSSNVLTFVSFVSFSVHN